MEDQKPKKIRKRVRNPASQIQELLDTDFATLSKDKTIKSAKLCDLAMARLACLQSLLLIKSEEEKARLKHADVDVLMKENAELKAEVARLRAELGKTQAPVTQKTEETFEEKMARRGIAI